jgi:hypothetical protein
MFPVAFVRQVIEEFCPVDGAVLDPFCGRGTVPYVASVTGRLSLGIDVNEVAYVFSTAKTHPEPKLANVLARIAEVGKAVRRSDRTASNEFQRWAWSSRVLGFLNAARRELDWLGSRLDCTVMALLLVYLHGKAGGAISNQMRQTKSMAPEYAVRWWKERELEPPDIDPVAYFEGRATWRYKHGVPQRTEARIELGDARQVLPRSRRRFAMLLTSPPYCGVTNYYWDNWIRLWMLGRPAWPIYGTGERYVDRRRYEDLLRGVFSAARDRLLHDAVIYVRTDSRSFTRQITQTILTELWPRHRQYSQSSRPEQSQTRLFGDAGIKPGETDFLMIPKSVEAPVGFQPSVCEAVACPEFKERRSARREGESWGLAYSPPTKVHQ